MRIYEDFLDTQEVRKVDTTSLIDDEETIFPYDFIVGTWDENKCQSLTTEKAAERAEDFLSAFPYVEDYRVTSSESPFNTPHPDANLRFQKMRWFEVRFSAELTPMKNCEQVYQFTMMPHYVFKDAYIDNLKFCFKKHDEEDYKEVHEMMMITMMRNGSPEQSMSNASAEFKTVAEFLTGWDRYQT